MSITHQMDTQVADKYIKRTEGFTLVELSIVIIIVGFLIAGISAGQSLIKQARLGSVISDMNTYTVAYRAFIIRYHGIPGDMQEASSYFPNCGEANASVCNGNNDGSVQFQETWSAWRVLSLAGMINAQIAPVPQSWSWQDAIGSTIPGSNINNAGYKIVGVDASNYNWIMTGSGVDSTSIIPLNNVINTISIGRPGKNLANDWSWGLGDGALTPEDAFNIDSKTDDGTVLSNGSFSGATTGHFGSSQNPGNFYNLPASNFYCQLGGNYQISLSREICVSGLALD